jgi:hypothetical protein
MYVFIIHLFISGSTALFWGPVLFFSFVIFFTQTVRLLGRWISPLKGRYLTQNKRTHADINALSGVRTHDPSVRASEDSSYLRPRGRHDRQKYMYVNNIIAEGIYNVILHAYKVKF